MNKRIVFLFGWALVVCQAEFSQNRNKLQAIYDSIPDDSFCLMLVK